MSPLLSSERRSLDASMERAGFYPTLLADVVHDALDGREPLSHLIHLETHFERTEVHRHITVLVLTEDMLVITHVDDQQLDEAGEQMMAQVSTESVPVTQIRSVVLGYMYAQPQDYKPSDQARELTLAIAWSGGQRLDMGPAGCADPQCDADHGYTGTIAQEDIVLRVSAEADGAQAVQNAKDFARALRKVNTDTVNARAMEPGDARQRVAGIGSRFNRSHHQR
ncbi:MULTISPECIES: DUF5998 family protein [Arthrobacter]|uniref:Cell wall biosynthesis glycosyltransferase n=1 Tax=Arthrobacter sunyaminii TaxID=2816859 RepID=A0A975XM30_9MICC|nr:MULTISPECIES: DUF5998 family protein [Arthrobacter]MBO0906745.1 hypothetical protein [Arthrobacter sunyaminii]QWQ37520.1 hypothetical protein KG104_07255 [Arthrobacter sunyaminii]